MKEIVCFDDAVKETCEAKINDHESSVSSDPISYPNFSSKVAKTLDL